MKQLNLKKKNTIDLFAIFLKIKTLLNKDTPCPDFIVASKETLKLSSLYIMLVS